MSKKTPNTLTCPKCDHTANYLVWDSLNVTVDPEDKPLLFEAKINMFECKECSEPFFIDVVFAYHVMDKKFYVQYIPDHQLEDPENFQMFSPDGSKIALPGIRLSGSEYMEHPHIVFSMNELVNYVIFRDLVFDLHNQL